MANLELSLSAKAREDGKHQVLVRVSSSRSVRFRIKSGVFVSLQFWSDSLHTVKVPVFRKTNKAVVDAARAEEAALDNYVSELKAIICAGEDMPGVTLSPEWIDHCYELRPILQDERNHFLPSITNGLFSPPNIQRAERMVEERQAAEKSDVEQKERNRLLYDLIQDYCRARNLAESRIKVYRVLGRMLGRFESFVQLTDKKRKGYSLVVSKVSSVDIEEFREFMRKEGSLQEEYPTIFQQILLRFPQTEKLDNDSKNLRAKDMCNRPIRNRGENYVCVTMKRLKALCVWCRETGRTDIDAFRGVEVGSEKYGTPYYITKEERDQIADFDLSSAPLIVQQQRDIFIFQCLIGCRISDLYSLRSENIQNGMLRYSPKKTEDETGIVARVPLTDRALCILQKYNGVDKKGRLMPFVSEQRYNDYIKQIFKVCGITRQVIWRNPTTGKSEIRPINEVASSHLARRTFCGNLYRQVKDPNLIGAMSGHTAGSKAFARYRNIDDDILTEVISTIN